MRIIAGRFKGKRLLGPSGDGIRPTPNKVKEALFSIIGSHITDARVADLYAGTGAIGIEALSRGAHHVSFIDSNQKALALLQKNLDLCQLTSQVSIHRTAVERFLHQGAQPHFTYDVLFADPPYSLDVSTELLPSIASSDTIHAQSLVILEHSSKAVIPQSLAPLTLHRQYRYGDTTLSVFTPESEKEQDQ